MPSNKDRLYVSLHARAGQPRMPGLEDTYQWAFIMGPKIESPEDEGVRFHAKETRMMAGEPPTMQWVWVYDEAPTSLQPTQMILVRVLIGKVKDQHRVRDAFRNTRVRPEISGWNCVSWVQDGLQEVLKDRKALVKASVDWYSVRDTAMWYVERKKAEHRFDGQEAYPGAFDRSKIATWDMLAGEELIP